MKKATLVFEKHELVLDVKQRAFAIARSAAVKSDAPDKDDHWLMDIANADELPREISGRIMNKAYLEAYFKVSPIAAEEESGDYVESDRYVEVSNYTMHLSVSDEAQSWKIRGLHDLIHEYIVYKTLLMWCELVARDYLDVLAVRTGEIEKQINTALKPLQGEGGERPYFPFG